MYYEFFGLTEAPFRITPNTDFFFGGGNRGPILEALIYAVTQGQGIVKVSGEVGSGKTMLCNMLIARLPQNIETVYIANPNVTPGEILQTIVFDLQLAVEPTANRLALTRALQDYLLERYAEGKRVVLFVEESQGMPLATLEEIRLLSNLETRNDKLLQIVLFGQPELDNHLRHPDIRQLRERITHSFTLEPLSAADIREYLMFRMRTAGYRGPELFGSNVVRMIAHASAGLTRRVNLIADKALLAAFAENTHTLKPRHIRAALRDSEFSDTVRGASPAMRWGWIAAGLAGVVAGAAGYAWFAAQGQQPPIAAPAAAPVAAAPGKITPQNAAAGETTLPPAAPPRAADAPAVPNPPAPDAPNPPAPAATPAATAAPAKGDVFQQRLQATEQWLSRQGDAVWTLQILATASESNLRDYLDALRKSIEINDIYVYRALGRVEQKAVFLVFYGSYDSQIVAERALARLPAKLQSNAPWPRAVQSIRDRAAQGR